MRLSLKCTLVVAIAVGGCAATGGKGSVNVPHLELEDVNGRQHYLSDYIGKKKAVVMTFWATWCMPCRIELRHLMKIYEQQKDNGLEVLAVSIDGPETVSRVRPFVRQAGYTFPVLIDKDSRAVALYNPRRQAPLMHIFNASGKIVYSHATYRAAMERGLRRKILQVLRSDDADSRPRKRRRPKADED